MSEHSEPECRRHRGDLRSALDGTYWRGSSQSPRKTQNSGWLHQEADKIQQQNAGSEISTVQGTGVESGSWRRSRSSMKTKEQVVDDDELGPTDSLLSGSAPFSSPELHLFAEQTVTGGNHQEIHSTFPNNLKHVFWAGECWTYWPADMDPAIVPPLMIAGSPVVPNYSDASLSNNLRLDPFPYCKNISEIRIFLAKSPEAASFFLSKFTFTAILFLRTRRVMFIYTDEAGLQQDRRRLPATLGGFGVSAHFGAIEPTSDEVGSTVTHPPTGFPASFGVTFKKDDQLYHTLPSHFPHEMYRRALYWWSKIWAWLSAAPPPTTHWPPLVGNDGTNYDEYMTFDKRLGSHSEFPTGYDSDISLVKATDPLQHPGLSLKWHPHYDNVPPKTIFEMLKTTAEIESLDKLTVDPSWYTDIGIGVTKHNKSVKTEHFATCNLWRGIHVGKKDGDGMQSLVGCSGAALAERLGPGEMGIFGFQSFQLVLFSRPDSHNLSDEEVKDNLVKCQIGFYGSFILPKELVQEFEIV